MRSRTWWSRLGWLAPVGVVSVIALMPIIGGVVTYIVTRPMDKVDVSGWDMPPIEPIVGPIPKSGSCTARQVSGSWLPDPRCSPGITNTNPRISQDNIQSTICQPTWVAAERARLLATADAAQARLTLLAAYGAYEGGDTAHYRLGLVLPLSLGGAVNDYGNMWVVGKDAVWRNAVAKAANHAVCLGQLDLVTAEEQMRTSVADLAARLGVPANAQAADPDGIN